MFQLHYSHLQANYSYKNVQILKLYTNAYNHKILIHTNFHTNGQPEFDYNMVETWCQEVMWQININIKNIVLKL